MDQADLQKLDSLTTARGHLGAFCEDDVAPVVLDTVRGKDGKDYAIQIANPCEAIEVIDRQIEILRRKKDTD